MYAFESLNFFCVWLFVCVRESERKREKERKRERKKERKKERGEKDNLDVTSLNS